MAMAMPVGTRARPPPWDSHACSRATRSNPPSPGWAYAGRGRSGSRRTRGRASTPASLRGAVKVSAATYAYDRPMLVWMDLEMTGLDPARHAVVEIATIITDDDLEIVAEGPDLVVHADEAAL